MKVIFLLVSVLLSQGAFAEKLLVYKKTHAREKVVLSYEVEKDLGRAWVEIELYTDTYGEDEWSKKLRTKVEGLSYNPELKAIEYQKANGETVVCANIKTKKMLGFYYDSKKSTGNCKLSFDYNVEQIDDGYSVRKASVLNVYFEVLK